MACVLPNSRARTSSPALFPSTKSVAPSAFILPVYRLLSFFPLTVDSIVE